MKKYNIKLRHLLAILMSILCFIILVTKLIYLETDDYSKLKRAGDIRSNKDLDLKAYRGIILDRNGSPLAVSTLVKTLWINPRFIKYNSLKLQQAFNILKTSKKEQSNIIKKIKSRQGRSGFIYLARDISPEKANKIKQLKIKAINQIIEHKRFYPTAEVTSQVVGFTNIDGKGQAGIELQFNKYLQGKNGYLKYQRDLKGGIANKNNEKYVKPINGKNIELSIDSRLQYIAYKYLKQGVIKNKANSGSVIIENVHTGEILAMANYPSFNPNNRKDMNNPEDRKNKSIANVYELGSVMKTFAAVTALSNGWNPKKLVNTSPGYYHIGTDTVRDERSYGKVDLRYILLKSSNVGISKIILSFAKRNLLMNMLDKFGFGHKTGIQLPGERSGYAPIKDKWGKFELATLSFGYGMNATDLQLVAAISALANKGIYAKPTILKLQKGQKPQTKRIVTKKIAKEMLNLLSSVVNNNGGTGVKARTNLYNVAGKTGTARMLENGQYTANYLASFVGVAPLSNPKIAIVVTIENPQGNHYTGGSVSAPVFSKIAENSLELMGVNPDKSI